MSQILWHLHPCFHSMIFAGSLVCVCTAGTPRDNLLLLQRGLNGYRWGLLKAGCDVFFEAFSPCSSWSSTAYLSSTVVRPWGWYLATCSVHPIQNPSLTKWSNLWAALQLFNTSCHTQIYQLYYWPTSRGATTHQWPFQSEALETYTQVPASSNYQHLIVDCVGWVGSTGPTKTTKKNQLSHVLIYCGKLMSQLGAITLCN